MYRDKICTFINLVSESDDSDCLDMINDLVESAADYIKRVNILEAGLITARINCDPSEYRNIIERLDKMRSAVHNDLIINVKAVNRLCRAHNIPLLFEGNEEERIEIAEFALNLSNEIFNTRRR